MAQTEVGRSMAHHIQERQILLSSLRDWEDKEGVWRIGVGCGKIFKGWREK